MCHGRVDSVSLSPALRLCVISYLLVALQFVQYCFCTVLPIRKRSEAVIVAASSTPTRIHDFGLISSFEFADSGPSQFAYPEAQHEDSSCSNSQPNENHPTAPSPDTNLGLMRARSAAGSHSPQRFDSRRAEWLRVFDLGNGWVPYAQIPDAV